jgi:molecular chaperone GrpE
MSENEGANADDAPDGASGEPAGEESDVAESTASDRPGGVSEDLLARAEESDAEELARELAELRSERDALAADVEGAEARIEELESKLKRKQADFQNFKKRQERRREEEKRRATEELVERLLDVRDNLQRALDQDEDVDIRDGVESTLRGFDDVLEREDVAAIEPDPGDDVDPERHEVLTTVDSDQESGTVADCYRPGYEMAGKVIRAAQVTVSE